MTRNRCWTIAALVGTAVGLALSAAHGQIPALEERIMNSRLNRGGMISRSCGRS